MSSAAPATATARPFDGIISFSGGDWWYHNRAHYDAQLLRRLREHVPVLQVNSIGVRVPSPSEGTMFFRRVARKLASIGRGLVRVDERLSVYSPLAVPGRLGMRFSRALLAAQVKAAARRVGIRRPLLWVVCPPAAEVVDSLDAAGLIYQRTDRWEKHPEVDEQLLKSYHLQLSERADLVLYCSTLLLEEEGSRSSNAVYLDHGVDFERFAQAPAPEPADLRDTPRPRAGFVGGIDALTFDPELLRQTARRLPDVQFVLIGACSLPTEALAEPNVIALGQKPYEQVAAYMSACDVLIMPWNRSEWIRACNPVKLKEYLAVGRPVVTSPFHELKRYQGFARVADGPEAFAQAIRASLQSPPDPEQLRERVRNETWDAKANLLLRELSVRGLVPSSS